MVDELVGKWSIVIQVTTNERRREGGIERASKREKERERKQGERKKSPWRQHIKLALSNLTLAMAAILQAVPFPHPYRALTHTPLQSSHTHTLA